MARELVLAAISRAPETTEALGESLGRVLGAGTLLALIGELGSGKTTLVRGLGRGLEVEDAIRSPTFTRMRVLVGRLPLHHFDAWRAGSESLFAEGAELLVGEGIAVVEWADRVGEWLPLPRIEIRLRHVAPGERSIQLRVLAARAGAGPAARALEEALSDALEEVRRTSGVEFLAAEAAGEK